MHVLCAALLLSLYSIEGISRREPVGAFWDGKFPERLPVREEFAVVNAFPHLTFEDPIGVLPEPRSDRLWVYTRQGVVYAFHNSPDETTKTITLDIRQHTQGWDDCGLLGMAFHPEFGNPTSPNRGYIYVWYQFTYSVVGSREQRAANVQPSVVSSNRLARFTVPDGATHADLSSELVLIDQLDRSVWHNGGGMFFNSDDGFLYLSLGDEGGAKSQFENDQLINKNLFSGAIRIDVDRRADRSHPIRRQPVDGRTANYFIPNDNPFVDASGQKLEEFWCLGLREPHRMTIDPQTHSIWAGDVGQEGREEINLIEKGGNYQWAFREGTIAGPKPRPATIIGLEKPPLYGYPHSSPDSALKDNAVIGGYVYRGEKHEALLGGQYIFGDNGSGRIWALQIKPTTLASGPAPLRLDDIDSISIRQIAQMPPGSGYGGLSGFGIDQQNEIYMCQMGAEGKIYRLLNPLDSPAQPLPPRLLSETALFTDLKTLQPAPALIPYTVNVPFWSDGAQKSRWIAVPNDGLPYGTNETIQFSSIGEWSFPNGTVFVKHFALPVNDSGATRRIETRVLIRDANGGAYGVSYRWREDESDADLVLETAATELPVQTATGTRMQKWTYPGPRDCGACHTPAAGNVLGVNTAQLNGPYADVPNQLELWNYIGMFKFDLSLNDSSRFPRLFSLDSLEATLQDKVRSYLSANCSQCHRPGGVRALMDFRYRTALQYQGLIGAPADNSLGLPHPAIIDPGSPLTSVLFARINRVGDEQMPPLGRNRIDALAVDTVTHWIRSLPPRSEVSGLLGQYFADRDFRDLRVTRTDPAVNFDWGLSNPNPEELPDDAFSARWTGALIPPISGTYILQTTSDDGVRLWIDGKLLIDNWTDHPPQINSAQANLIAGHRHDLRLEYYEASGGAQIRLWWQPPGRAAEVIPQQAFRSAPATFISKFPAYIYWDANHNGEFHLNAETLGDYELQQSNDLINWTTAYSLPSFRGSATFHPEQPTPNSAAYPSAGFYRAINGHN